jgi:hypothetical protein
MIRQEANRQLSDTELDTIALGKGGSPEPTNPGAAFAIGFFGLILFPVMGVGAAIAEIEKPGSAKNLFDSIFS